MSTWDNITSDLKKIWDINWVSIELIWELLEAEKVNLWNRWSFHKSMIETIIRKHII
jgi:hypothetical protein